ncbi:4-diphosphocytidyl-2-C-methyl-D-erythritol kinase [Candidatus Hepatincola sp. Pdp]
MFVTYFAKAKINLYLHVLGKLESGLHNLESLVAFCNLADKLTFTLSNKTSIHIAGEFASLVPDGANNLIFKIITYFQKFSNDFNLQVDLIKNIPVAAGLGGGSADGAATILACNQLLNLNLSKNELLDIAEKFGSDIPVCLQGKVAFMLGSGIQIIPTTLPLKKIYILLVNPKAPLLTAKIFQGITNYEKPQELPVKFTTTKDLFSFLKQQNNSLISNAIHELPIIEDILNTLKVMKGSVVSMSGSGATCFALYSNEELANKAKQALEQKYPNFWVQKSFIV